MTIDHTSRDSEPSLLVLENKAMYVAVDAKTGVITKLVNKLSGLSLIHQPTSDIVWRLKVTEQATWLAEANSFAYELAGQTLHLLWSLPHHLTLIARIELPDDEDAVYFFVRIENKGTLSVEQVEYPILTG